MMTKKRVLLAVFIFAAIISLLSILVVMLPDGPGVTRHNFGRINAGMTKADVIEILGYEPWITIHVNTRPPKLIGHTWEGQSGTAYIFFGSRSRPSSADGAHRQRWSTGRVTL
jgi:hypothetical protein